MQNAREGFAQANERRRMKSEQKRAVRWDCLSVGVLSVVMATTTGRSWLGRVRLLR
jgi:hypothetical protein